MHLGPNHPLVEQIIHDLREAGVSESIIHERFIMTDTSHLKALGRDVVYNFDKPSAAILEAFDSPYKGLPRGAAGSVLIRASEFTSLCPLTGQPDFATIVVEYVPRDKCIESKSFKLYLGSFRMHGDFHESCITRIATDLIDLLDPWHLTVVGEFTPRGGIPFWPRVDYASPEHEEETIEGRRVV